MLTLHQTTFQAIPLSPEIFQYQSEIMRVLLGLGCAPVVSIVWCKVVIKLSLSQSFSRLDVPTKSNVFAIIVLSLGSEVKSSEHRQQPMGVFPPAPNKKQ